MNPAEVAAMIDHSLLHPALTDAEMREGCGLAVRLGTASVCVKPCGVRLAAGWLEGSGVKTGTVIGFPHGNSSIRVKVFETDHACREGAVEIDMVINIGKALGGDWGYVEEEIRAVRACCREHGALIKVIFENDLLPDPRMKIRLCEICTREAADFAKTSTGYGFVRDPDGRFSAKGATDEDLRLMRLHCGPDVRIKAAGGIRTLDDLLRVKALGADRVGATATAAIVSEAVRRQGGGRTDTPAREKTGH
ncbi:deoxyribose-phosphate aldolase [bacterium]|nr:deoxyribose-phosphate aldolase [bacterium]